MGRAARRGPLTPTQRRVLVALDRAPKDFGALARELWGAAATPRHCRPAGRVIAHLRARGLVRERRGGRWALDYQALSVRGLPVAPGYLHEAALDGWPRIELDPGRWREVHRHCGEAIETREGQVEWRWERGPNSLCPWCHEPLPGDPRERVSDWAGIPGLFEDG